MSTFTKGEKRKLPSNLRDVHKKKVGGLNVTVIRVKEMTVELMVISSGNHILIANPDYRPNDLVFSKEDIKNMLNIIMPKVPGMISASGLRIILIQIAKERGIEL